MRSLQRFLPSTSQLAFGFVIVGLWLWWDSFSDQPPNDFNDFDNDYDSDDSDDDDDDDDVTDVYGDICCGDTRLMLDLIDQEYAERRLAAEESLVRFHPFWFIA